MTSNPEETNPPQREETRVEIAADEDWKSKVKEEDAQLDRQRAEQQRHARPEQGSRTQTRADVDFSKLPPPGIDTVVQLFATQAMVALGLVPGPEGNADKQLPLARHFIDLLSVLEEKTKGNLSADEARLLDSTLHELRMAFVELSKK